MRIYTIKWTEPSIIYSIIETCKANNVNTYDYLRYLFEIFTKPKMKKNYVQSYHTT